MTDAPAFRYWPDKLEFVYALCLLTANIEKMICVA